jgi:ADP-heptose:LPS heptosyltransferase
MPREDADLESTQPKADLKSTLTAIISSKQLGDVTLLEPMTRLLAARTGKPVALFVKEAFRPLVELMPHACWGPELDQPIDELWATSWGGKTAVKAFKLRADKKILLHNKIEQRRWWYRFIFDEFKMERHGLEYWGLYFWRMVGGAADDFKSSVLNQPPADWRCKEVSEEAYMVLVPTSAWPSKQWGAHQWAELAMKLAENGKYPRKLLMLGGNQEFEREHCSQIEALSAGRLQNLCAKTTLKEYLHLLSGAAAVVTVDGSASHLAQAFGRPVVTIFGPTQDQRWHFSTPKHKHLAARNFCPEGKEGPAALVPTAAVIEALEEIIAS